MAISVSGIGSGLDIEGIVTQLMAVERQPLLQLVRREGGFAAQISAVGTLKSAVSAFQEAAAALGESDSFEAVTTSSSNEDVVTLSATGEAALGGMSIEVLRLAQTHKQASAAAASADTFGGGAGDQLTLTVGSGELVIDLSTAKSLAQIRDEINAAAGDIGLTATLLDETGDGSATRLVLSATETGFDNRIQMAFAGVNAATLETGFGFTTINSTAEGTSLAALEDLDASFSIDGFVLGRGSNTIDDALTGLTLELQGVGSATASVGRDSSGAGNALDAVVKAYNALTDTLNELRNGDLGGDSILRSIETSIRSALSQSFAGLGDIRSLSQLGVEFTREGDLTFDRAALDAAVTADKDAVAAFFTGEGGFFERLDGLLTGYLETNGILDTRVDGLNARIDDVQEQQARMEVRLESIERRLRAQFSALDGLVAQLSATSQFLVNQLDNLPGAINPFVRRDN